MFESVFIYLFVFIIFLVMFLEYRNDKKYQDERDKERKKYAPKKPVEPETTPKEIIEEEPEAVNEVIPKEIVEVVQPEVVVEVKPEPEPEVEIEYEEVVEEKPEEIQEEKELPNCEYPPFTHVRLVEMGLSDDEATEFVHELIPQLEEQISLIEESINIADFHQVERLTHGIKGSATNLGTGGVSDLLVEYNTYVKSGEDVDIVKAYQKHFIHYIDALKKQYA